jgi:serine/threonine protein kinase
MDESTSLSQPSMIALSDQRIGSYRVLNPLGAGGMSSVFRAVHVETGNEVALKVLTRTLARNATLLQRFLREARSVETLQHPNIVTIYDRGIDRGRHYLVLEYVGGSDFHEYIRDRGPLPAAEAISVVRSVAAGLNYAATRGLIHRDIKPSNVLRTPAGQIKIIDLGLALQNEFEDERVTREGTTVGTVDYMAPEQARDSRATSIQSDIYSLGCTLYYFLSGVPPFPGGDITDKLTRHAKSPVPNVCELRQDVPANVATLIEKMMAKKPEDRFRSYDELIAALDDIAADALEDAPAIALVPLDTHNSDQQQGASADSLPGESNGEYAASGSGSEFHQDFTLAELAGELEGESGKRSSARSPIVEPATPMPRQGRDGNEATLADDTELREVPFQAPSQPPSYAAVWIISGAFIGVAVILLVIGMIQFMDSSPVATKNAVIGAVADVVPERPITVASRISPGGITKKSGIAKGELTQSPVEKATPYVAEPEWLEPIDHETVDSGAGKIAGLAETDTGFLPDWSRSPIPERIDGPFVVVRRTFTGSDPFKLPALDLALDQHIGGTIELADEGPLFVDDLRVAGNTRLIRARPGYRPIVRIEGSSVEAVRNLRGVFVLDGKNLTLVLRSDRIIRLLGSQSDAQELLDYNPQ